MTQPHAHPSHLLADVSEQVVISQGKAAHLFRQLQSPLRIEREKEHFRDHQLALLSLREGWGE